MLLTTFEVDSFEQALEKIAWYNKRWGIEVYHRTLKSGCRIENRQLGERRFGRTVWPSTWWWPGESSISKSFRATAAGALYGCL